LPPQAIWACIDGQAYQGKLSITSLRALTGAVERKYAIFVEDQFAADLVEEILRQLAGEALHEIEVHCAGGYPYVVNVLEYHNKNPTVTNKAVAVIDGDNPVEAKSKQKYVFRLPGDAPENVVFGYIFKNAASVAALVQQRCQCPALAQDDIVKAIEKVQNTAEDHHLYFRRLGDELGFISEIVVRRGLCSIYVEKNKTEIEPLVKQIVEQLHKE
jgi:hypothetical protein